MLALTFAPEAEGQGGARVGDAGPGRPGRILRAALLEPHVLIVRDTGAITTDTGLPAPDTSLRRAAMLALPRDTVFTRPVIIVGRSATVASVVEGDVIVVGGDLFLHPGALISGRAIAIGGGVYSSTLALAQGGRLAFRDATFVARRESDGLVLDYRAIAEEPQRGLRLAGVRGFWLPAYTRVDGLSIPFTIAGAWDDPGIDMEVTATWRSHIGAVDPRIVLGLRFDRRTWIELSAGRRTLTNDAWIRRSALNSLHTLATGRDARNYYRAHRGDIALARLWEGETAEIAPFIGALVERAWSVGPRPADVSAPWSVTGRDDPVDGMLRPNPPVAHGWTMSTQLGARAVWEEAGLLATASLSAELPFRTADDSRWQQMTLDTEVEFPALGSHTLEVAAHLVATFGDVPPPQRFAWLGGSGTLPTFDLLSFGGDQLLFAEGRYTIPIEGLVVPRLGSPRVAVRYMIGAAGTGRLPPLEQNVGLRLALALLKLDWTVEPVSGETRLSFGLTSGR